MEEVVPSSSEQMILQVAKSFFSATMLDSLINISDIISSVTVLFALFCFVFFLFCSKSFLGIFIRTIGRLNRKFFSDKNKLESQLIPLRESLGDAAVVCCCVFLLSPRLHLHLFQTLLFTPFNELNQPPLHAFIHIQIA